MALEKYHAKRDFGITPEPRGDSAAKASGTALTFVIQKHAASRLHYDFRLELDGVLLSWAVPKGPSFVPADKRLAMQTEDHPLEYGGFEGIIPAKQYGGGTVMLWDRGEWTPIGDPHQGYAKGNLKFTLHGQKMQGNWALVRTHGSKYGGKSGKDAWLLIKEKDEFARNAEVAPIVDSAPDSVSSGRSLDAIANDKEHVWQSNLTVGENVKAGAVAKEDPGTSTKRKGATKSLRATVASKATSPAGAARIVSPPATLGKKASLPATLGKKAPLPAMLAPVLATLVSAAPAGDEWLHEIKYDGYRMLCRIDRGRARIFSRNGKEWTTVLRPLAATLAMLPVRNAWIDGEVCALDAAGRTSFQALQNALSTPDAELSYFAFDLVYLDGMDLRDVILTERKRMLRAIVDANHPSIRIGPEVTGGGPEFFSQACSLGLEGAICKRADSLYADGNRSRDWLKVKCVKRQEMVIGGYTEPQGSRTGFGALLLGVHAAGKLRYAGKVGTGFDERTLAEIYQLLQQREQREPAFTNPPRGYEAKGAHWVRPDLVAEVAFTEWSTDGALRHPSFQGLRMDKKAADVVREEAAPQTVAVSGAATTGKRVAGRRTTVSASTASPSAAPNSTSKTRAAAASAITTRPQPRPADVAGVPLSNPDKVLFPEAALTKRDIAEYYAAIAPWLLPHINRRPLSLVRCPDGWTKQCFYQKHADKSVNAAVARIPVAEGDGAATYMGASTAKALVALVQWGVLEFHPWGSRQPRLDRPDQLVFDFDPDEGYGWSDLVTAVTLTRTLLNELDLESFIKTTGGKGLHVVVPIRPTLTWDAAKGFSRAVAEFLVRTFPDRFTATISKAKRKGKIFVDYLRNGEGATAVAPFVVRSRANAPVATPIAWDELQQDVRFDFFNVRNIRARLATVADPWEAFATTRQSVSRAAAQRVDYVLPGRK